MDPSQDSGLNLSSAKKPVVTDAQKELVKFVELLKQYGVEQEMLDYLEEVFLKPIGDEAQLAKDKFAADDLEYFFSTRAELAQMGISQSVDEKILGDLGRAVFVAELVRQDPMLAIKLADSLPTKKYSAETGKRIQNFLKKHILTEHSPVTGSLVREFTAENTSAETGLLAGILELYLRYDNFNAKKLIERIADSAATAATGHGKEVADLSNSKMTRQQIELLRIQASEYRGPKPRYTSTPAAQSAPVHTSPPVVATPQSQVTQNSTSVSSTSKSRSSTPKVRVRTHSILDLPILDPEALGGKKNAQAMASASTTPPLSTTPPSSGAATPRQKLHPVLGIPIVEEVPDKTSTQNPTTTASTKKKDDDSEIHPTLGLKVVKKTPATTPVSEEKGKPKEEQPVTGSKPHPILGLPPVDKKKGDEAGSNGNGQAGSGSASISTPKTDVKPVKVHPVLNVPIVDNSDQGEDNAVKRKAEEAPVKQVKMHPTLNLPMKDTDGKEEKKKDEAEASEEQPKKVHGVLGLPLVDKKKD